MQLHSSLVPIALPLSVAIGAGSYFTLHAMGARPQEAVVIAEWIGGLVNVAIGVPKNLILGDLLSLILVRPLSAWGTVAAIAAIGGH